jgi:hypothetical protein
VLQEFTISHNIGYINFPGQKKKLPSCSMVSSLTADLPLFLPCLTERPVLARRYAHGTTGATRSVAPPPQIHKNLQEKALQHSDSNEFINLSVGASRVLMFKAATNNISNNTQPTILATIHIKHNVNIHM